MGARLSRLIGTARSPTPASASSKSSTTKHIPTTSTATTSTTRPLQPGIHPQSDHNEKWSRLLRDISGSITSKPWQSSFPTSPEHSQIQNSPSNIHIASRTAETLSKLPQRRANINPDVLQVNTSEKMSGHSLGGRLTMVQMLGVWRAWREGGLEKAEMVGKMYDMEVSEIEKLLKSARGMLGDKDGLRAWADPEKKLERFEDLEERGKEEDRGRFGDGVG